MNRTTRKLLFIFALLVGLALACSIPGSATQATIPPPPQQPAVQPQVVLPTNAPPASPTSLPSATQNQAETQAALETRVAVAAQATLLAFNQTQTAIAPPPIQPQDPILPSPTFTLEPVNPPASGLPPFEEWIRSASILIYEDMAADYSTTRYILQALNNLNLNYQDVGDALGHYKDALLGKGPGGRGWDLIISGKELHTAVSGEFYEYLNEALNDGSSVIIEDWDVDEIANGKISTILARCGVEFQRDWPEDSINEQVLKKLSGESPFHHYPNEGIALTNPTGYWWYELGDFLRLAPASKAIPLWAARANATNSALVSVTCLDNRLVIQTFCTHSYGKDRSVMNWENYIYNTLKARYIFLGGQ